MTYISKGEKNNMQEKQLMIGVPTKDHPRYIQFYLSRVLDDAKAYNIDLHIYDSSENDLTEHIVNQKIEQGYSNLYYHRYDANLLLEEKVKDILVDSRYEYVWLCEDGAILYLENTVPFISREMEKGRDLIVFDFLDRKERYLEYTDPLKLIVEQWMVLTLYGGTIYKGDLFLNEEWDRLFSLYTNNVPLGGIFDIFARRSLNAVVVDTEFCINNVYKDGSTWVKSGNYLQAVVDCMPTAVDRLPELYNPVKKQVARIFSRGKLMILPSSLWWLRANGNLTFKKAFKYRKQIRTATGAKVTNFHYMLLWGISIIPHKTAKKMANIFYYSFP